ncbi:MAG: poly-gamma-glutamate system protein [Candidatus Cloacimonetes bacterium]|nr:poly-gamma-glutamate system protein [Candidatus Cloacimonadota bacterium]MCF7813673.1 poly-gamma-glutamate system protein [Candidatus Cloacimonadota bacterium]MCF7867171.1 poly-gamma-glutamate system protein [Candidatus Cloacimonadota bacterium]MCF7882509.1 poly-gamma-glutamate system protein [Candidatus Cloacimonadota bacterium]
MFVPSAKSSLSLLVLLIVSILLFIWVENSRVYVSEKYFEEKMAAANLMQKAMNTIKEHRLSQDVFIDEVNDPNLTGLIGEKQSLIVTDRGNLTAKLTSLNPNLAAALVDIFKKAKLQKGDKVAMSCTGSFPAMNIAVMSAAKIMELDLVIISSVGASMFGATDPDFTWLDMESLLNDKNIFEYRSYAASLGGGRDLGRGLNVLGREKIIEAIERNNITLVHEETLEQNISKKMEFFEDAAQGKPYDLYINVGGGLSSLGNSINGRLLKPGFHKYVNLKNIPLKGTMFLMADKKIPVLHLLDISRFARTYDLPDAPDPLPEPGTGNMFKDEIYNVTIASIALAILVILVLLVIFFDHKQLKLRHDEIEI